MDSFQLWKDDYRREVEEVLSERRRAREKGERSDAAPGEGFAGRLADLVIPPAGVHAEAAALRSRLDEAEALNADLLRRAQAAEAASGLERDRRERIKDAAARLAVELRGQQAELLVAREQARLSYERVADAERSVRERAGIDEARVREARMDGDHATARAEDAERASTARRQDARLLHARFDALQLEDEGKSAEIAALKTRLETAIGRVAESESRAAELERRLHAELSAARAELASARSAVEEHSQEGADLEKRAKEHWEAARSAADLADRMRAELRSETVRCETLETALQQEALRAASAQRAADEAGEAAKASDAKAEAIVAAARGERAKAHEEAAAIRDEADRLHAEGERALADARRQEAEIPARLAAAIGDERASAELARAAAASALAKAKAIEKEALTLREESERHLADEGARLSREAEQRAETAFAEGLAAERLRAEHAEREVERARLAEEGAREKTREMVLALAAYRDRMKNVAAKLSARGNRDHIQIEAESRRREAEAVARLQAETARQAANLEGERSQLKAELERMKDVAARLVARVSQEHVAAENSAAELKRRAAEEHARIEAEAGRQAAILEEERASLKSELEEERGRLEAAVDAERAGLQERWREQAELLEKMRQARGRNPEP